MAPALGGTMKNKKSRRPRWLPNPEPVRHVVVGEFGDWSAVELKEEEHELVRAEMLRIQSEGIDEHEECPICAYIQHLTAERAPEPEEEEGGSTSSRQAS